MDGRGEDGRLGAQNETFYNDNEKQTGFSYRLMSILIIL